MKLPDGARALLVTNPALLEFQLQNPGSVCLAGDPFTSPGAASSPALPACFPVHRTALGVSWQWEDMGPLEPLGEGGLLEALSQSAAWTGGREQAPELLHARCSFLSSHCAFPDLGLNVLSFFLCKKFLLTVSFSSELLPNIHQEGSNLF